MNKKTANSNQEEPTVEYCINTLHRFNLDNVDFENKHETPSLFSPNYTSYECMFELIKYEKKLLQEFIEKGTIRYSFLRYFLTGRHELEFLNREWSFKFFKEKFFEQYPIAVITLCVEENISQKMDQIHKSLLLIAERIQTMVQLQANVADKLTVFAEIIDEKK